MAKKSFFKERTKREIQEFRSSRVYRRKGLVEKIDGLPKDRVLEIRVQIIPGRFFVNVETGAEASRKAYKHGDLIALSHPKTRGECYTCPDIPLSIRARDFAKLRQIKEEEINFVGYSVQPTWSDRTKRVFPFVWHPEGIKLFAYAENMTPKGIVVEPYADAKRVRSEGASVAVEVPSRTRKNPRYKFKLNHVPIVRGRENLASVLTLKPWIIQKDEESVKERTLHDIYNIRYTWEGERERSEIITFYPHDVAGYLGIIKSELAKHNLTPMEMNPFALPSQHQADFYTKLCNNVLIYDPTLNSKNKLRKLHLAEKSILLARGIGKFGHDDFAFWDWGRDGKLKDYDWGLK